ncbi:hypothetical protein GOV14_03800, partial [Candidatus Pacearchaeota archaeon]|nr:hypothetical protein [Candidatus Pacearchaeota archaeon]
FKWRPVTKSKSQKKEGKIYSKIRKTAKGIKDNDYIGDAYFGEAQLAWEYGKYKRAGKDFDRATIYYLIAKQKEKAAMAQEAKHHLFAESEGLVEKVFPEGVARAAGVLIFILGSIFFASNSLTGNAILKADRTVSNIFGVAFFLIGIIGTYVLIRQK